MTSADDWGEPEVVRLPVLGNRMSALPVAEFCGHSATLSEEVGAGDAARISTYFHALCSGKGELPAITPEEREEVGTWVKPDKVEIHNGEVLLYSDAETELEVGLGEDGRWKSPQLFRDECVSIGHLDFAWQVCLPADEHFPRAYRVAYVADIKKSAFTASDGPESLQLMAYALSYASWRGAEFFCTGIFVAEDGEWQWLNRLIPTDGPEADALRARVVKAALNKGGQPSTGQHCRNCWNRWRCTAHLLPAAAADTYLAPICDGGELTRENARDVLLRAQAAKDLAERAIGLVKAFVEEGNELSDAATGKVYRAIRCKGREGVSVADLRKEMGPSADKYIRRGNPYSMLKWVNK